MFNSIHCVVRRPFIVERECMIEVATACSARELACLLRQAARQNWNAKENSFLTCSECRVWCLNGEHKGKSVIKAAGRRKTHHACSSLSSICFSIDSYTQHTLCQLNIFNLAQLQQGKRCNVGILLPAYMVHKLFRSIKLTSVLQTDKQQLTTQDD